MTIRRVGALWAIQSCAVGWLHGADARSIALGTAVVMLQAYAGILVWHRILAPAPQISSESVGLGAVSAVVVQSLLVAAGGHRVPMLSIAIPVMVIAIIHLRLGRSPNPTMVDGTTALVVISTSSIGLMPWSWSLSTIVVTAWAIAWLLRRRVDLLVGSVGLVALGVGIWTFNIDRSRGWLVGMISNDTLLDEALSQGLMQWGVGENMGLLGHPTRYHVLAHAWAGQLSTDLGLSGFVAHLVLQPSLSYTAIGCLIAGLARRVGAHGVGVIAAGIATFAQASATEALFPVEFIKSNMTLGTASSLALLCMMNKDIVSDHTRRFVLIFIASLAATGIKLHFAAIVALGAALSVVSDRDESVTQRVSLAFAAIGGVGVGWAVFFQGTHGTTGVLSADHVLQWSSLLTALSAAVIAVSRLPIWPDSLNMPRNRVSLLLSRTTIAALSIYALLGMTSTGEASGRNYAITFAFVSGAPLVGRSIETAWGQLSRSKRQIATAAALAIGLGVAMGFEVLKWRAYTDGPRVVLRALVTEQLSSNLIVILATTLVTLALTARTRRSNLMRAVTAVVLVATSGVVFAVKVARQPINELAYGDLPVEAQEAGYVSAEFNTLVTWISENTPTSAIVATTVPCLARTTAGPTCTIEDCADWRIGAMAIAGRTGRRVWLEAPSYMSDASDQALLGGEIERRYLVIRTARKGESSWALDQMRRDGVEFLVVDARFPLAYTPQGVAVVFRNDAFEVLEL